ncbi:MAG: PAS domain S-box protein [Holophaga sp.]|nr:PAS domain S-box protein [Holophaga sp.]
MTLSALFTLFAIVLCAVSAVALAMARSREKATRALRATEEKFTKIFQTSPDAINLADQATGVCLDLNPSYIKLFGYSREEALGRSVLPGDLGIWVNREDRDRFNAVLQDRGEVLGFEVTLRRKDGSTLTALVSSCAMEVNGERCNLSLTRDITERKRAEEALRESAQRLELAVRSGNLGIWDRNLQDETLVWSDQMYEICGVDQAAFQPSYDAWLERIVHPEDREAVRAGVQAGVRAAVTAGTAYQLEFRIVRPDGAVRHIGSHATVVQDGAGRPVRVIGIHRDRTEQVEAESERRRLQEERQHSEKLESLGSLAGGMAHDMNNVLAGILGSAEMLREQFAAVAPVAKALDNIIYASGRGRDLVRGLTDFARKGVPEPQLFDLNEMLRKEVELLRHATLEKVQVVQDLDPHLPLLLGDASALGGAFMNLAVNALDAMPGGGTLSFRSRALAGDKIELTVADTGQGMSSEVLARAGEPFFTTKGVGKGTGLGLTRALGTVKGHGGSVAIQSAPDQGTTITLLLPCFQQARGEEPPGRAEAKQALHILLVDDDPMILETMPPLLRSLGHQVETASRGEAALTRLATGVQVDLVMLDHSMPGLTGTETLVRLRELRPDLPVILASGFVEAFTENLVTSLPKVWVLKKPFSLREIRKMLAAASGGIAV